MCKASTFLSCRIPGQHAQCAQCVPPARLALAFICLERHLAGVADLEGPLDERFLRLRRWMDVHLLVLLTVYERKTRLMGCVSNITVFLFKFDFRVLQQKAAHPPRRSIKKSTSAAS